MTLTDEITPTEHINPPTPNTTPLATDPLSVMSPAPFDTPANVTFAELAFVDHRLHKQTKSISAMVDCLDAQGHRQLQ